MQTKQQKESINLYFRAEYKKLTFLGNLIILDDSIYFFHGNYCPRPCCNNFKSRWKVKIWRTFVTLLYQLIKIYYVCNNGLLTTLKSIEQLNLKRGWIHSTHLISLEYGTDVHYECNLFFVILFHSSKCQFDSRILNQNRFTNFFYLYPFKKKKEEMFIFQSLIRTLKALRRLKFF